MAAYKVIGKGENGKYFDDKAWHDVISYALRESKTPNSYVGSRAVNIDNAEPEMSILARLYNKTKGVHLRHSIISFDESDNITSAEAAKIAAAAIQYFGDQYQIIYSIHEDAAHVHAHIVMNQVSYTDGHKYQGTKKEYYGFINYMNGIVQPYGIPFVPVSDNEEAL